MLRSLHPSKGKTREVANTHELRATLDVALRGSCGSGLLALIVRRLKPFIPLTTAPHRVSTNSRNSLPDATVARTPSTRPNAKTGAVSRITANETNSLVVKAFMSFLLVVIDSFATRAMLRECTFP